MKKLILAMMVLLIPMTTPASAVSVQGLDHRIKKMLNKINTRCAGFVLISGIRKTRIPGGRMSLHATGRAADFRVRNYSCAYRVLASWQYGMSNDARRCKHIHISVPGSHREKKGFRHRWC